MKELIVSGVLFLMALVVFLLSIRSFREKGFLLNNSYLYASQEERKMMDKRPYYRQSAVVLALIGFIFVLNGLSILLRSNLISYIAIGLVFIVIVYTVASSVSIERGTRKRNK